MKIALLNPQITVDPNVAIREFDIGEHVGLGYLASCLRENGHDVKLIYYFENEIKKTIEAIKEFNADLIGVTVLTETYPQAIQMINSLKKDYSKPIVVGGILPTILKEVFFNEFDPEKNIDYLIFGDGEDSLVQLVAAISMKLGDFSKINGLLWRHQEKIVINKYKKFLMELDKYPFPARDFAPTVISQLKDFNALPALRIITSRGCLGRCLFCHIAEFYQSVNKKAIWRFRSAENIYEEIKHLNSKYSVNYFLFSDDNFFGYGNLGFERAKKLAKLILSNDLKIMFSIQSRLESFDLDLFKLLKEAGLISVDFGIETINPESLKFFKKGFNLEKVYNLIQGLNKISGVAIGLYMLNIHPLSTVEETYLNYNFLNEIGYFEDKDRDKEVFRKLIASRCEITKYTRLYYEVEKMGLMSNHYKNNPVLYNFKFRDKNMTKFFIEIQKYVLSQGVENFESVFLEIINRYNSI